MDATTIQIPVEPPSAEAPKPETPAPILGKFKTQADLEKAYTELEKKLGSQTPATPANSTPPSQTKAEGDKPGLTIPNAQAPAELDISVFEKEYDEKGALSEESYAKLAKEHKVPKGLVDQFIQSRLQEREKFTASVFETVGGQDAYGEMMQWASSALSADEITAYDSVVTSGNPNAVKLAVAGLAARYQSANGREPRLIGGAAGSSGPAPFTSTAQVTAAMNDSRYHKDPSYRKEVEDRMAISKLF